MNIESKIKKGAKIVLNIGLDAGGIRHIKIIAADAESRDQAMAKVRTLLPAFELLETLLAPPDLSEAPSGQSESISI
jgi:hypothetical protein